MRTDKEIIARIREIKTNDTFGFQSTDLILCLPFEKAKPYLKDDVKKSDWEPVSRDESAILTRMLDYMSFAWEKANCKRGLSAWRSMEHYKSWIWLLGDEPPCDLDNYQYYGKPQLIEICKKYGWNYTKWDDGVREND